jgi:pyruvate,water dikinase
VTPDTYIVRKTDTTILSRQIAEKLRMTVLVPGGIKQVDVPRVLQNDPCIKDEQVKEMAQLAIALEKTQGWPVDIECTYQAKELFLLQCRPITSLAPKEQNQI